jgi:hypothetical protein
MSAAATKQAISRTDLERKMRELQGGVDDARASATSYAIAAGAVVVVAVVGIAFLMGRRKGKKGRTVVEVRRV